VIIPPAQLIFEWNFILNEGEPVDIMLLKASKSNAIKLKEVLFKDQRTRQCQSLYPMTYDYVFFPTNDKLQEKAIKEGIELHQGYQSQLVQCEVINMKGDIYQYIPTHDCNGVKFTQEDSIALLLTSQDEPLFVDGGKKVMSPIAKISPVCENEWVFYTTMEEKPIMLTFLETKFCQYLKNWSQGDIDITPITVNLLLNHENTGWGESKLNAIEEEEQPDDVPPLNEPPSKFHGPKPE
jgi:hypothetical protein